MAKSRDKNDTHHVGRGKVFDGIGTGGGGAPAYQGSKPKVLPLLVLLGTYAGFWILLAAQGLRISHEHGPMENAQAICLFAGFSFFIVTMWCDGGRAHQRLYGALALFYASFFLREVEVEDLDIPGILILLGSGVGKRIVLATAWLVALAFFVGYARQTWAAFVAWLRSPAGLSILIAGVFYLLGMPFDKKAFPLEYELNMFLEELLETLATVWMLISSVLSLLAIRMARAPVPAAIRRS